MGGVLAYGTYLPHARMRREAIAAHLGTGSGRGTRSVASFDEDTTSMAVEAARAALASAAEGTEVRELYFTTTRPAYADKTNAAAVHAALDLAADAPAADMVGAVRSGVAALRAALRAPEPALLAAADIRTGLPGSADERDGGDAAAALVCAAGGELIAEHLGGGSATAEFLDRWRAPGELGSRVWEERFGEFAYVPLAQDAIARAAERTGLSPADADHVIVTGTHARAVRRVAKEIGAAETALVDDLGSSVGNTGAAHPCLLLSGVLDVAEADATIALVVLADGVDVLFFRTTELLPRRRQRVSLAAQLAATHDELPYAKLQTWRGAVTQEPPRRPNPAPPASPPSLRSENWKFAFTGSRCECGTMHLPPARVCMSCHAVDAMTTERLSDVGATVATFTVDRLAHSENPPLVVGVVDFDGGGRFQCELTDVGSEVRIGDRVEMTFRRMFSADGIHNYFWKARPIRGEH